jgi:hypothetical protein
MLFKLDQCGAKVIYVWSSWKTSNGIYGRLRLPTLGGDRAAWQMNRKKQEA